MKKNFWTVILIALLVLLLGLAVSCTPADGGLPADGGWSEVFVLEYVAGEGGFVEGERFQAVESGKNGSTVTAEAFDGYVFSHWSDGVTDASRLDKNILENATLIAAFSKISGAVELTVTYLAGEGGYIIEGENVDEGEVGLGESIDEGEVVDENAGGGETFSVPYGGSLTVTAKADTGYEFVKWSDGSTDNPRTDENITAEYAFIAIFKIITITFEYNFNNASGGNSEPSITLSYDSLADTIFAIPTKEYFTFDGWYLDQDFQTQITDTSGTLLLSHEIFESEASQIHAKWTVIEQLTFKMLMVFVTEVKATLKTYSGEYIEVDYKLSDLEMEICKLIPQMVERTLNDMLEGLVTFEVDSYFTTQAVTESSFKTQDVSNRYDYRIYAEDIPETWHLLKDYRSIITTFSMDKHLDNFHPYSGIAHMKYASVHLEGGA